MLTKVPTSCLRKLIQREGYDQGRSLEDLSVISGVPRETLSLWSREKRKYASLYAAEKLVCRLGHHIGDIWPEYWED